jgi:predicted RNase H-like HicB family nuclease
MSDEVIFEFRESSEGGYEARAVEHSIFTQAETIEELREMTKDAVACHFAEQKTLPEIRLVKVQPPTCIFGSAKGEFTVPDDFNELDPEIEDLFYK